MKKTIAAIALMASSTTVLAFAPPPTEPAKTVCIKAFSLQDGSKVGQDCDDSDNNMRLNRPIKASGCAAEQVAITTYDELNIPKCMPAGAVQL